jgi:hypothetical protein
METLRLVREFLFPDSAAPRAIPSLDGGFVPNDALERPATLVEIPEPDDALLAPDGSLVVTSGRSVLRLSGDRFQQCETLATLPGGAGAIALAPRGGILVACEERGLLRVHDRGEIDVVAGEGLGSITAIAVLDDGTIVVTDGSRTRPPRAWVWDLMEKGASGRVVAIERGGAPRVVADGLAWPSGVALARDGSTLLVSEAWRHAIRRIPLGGGRAEPLAENLPGYPGRLAPAPDGVWTAFFALRTQLVDFVLDQDDFREEMMRTIDPRWWIRPDLRTINSGLVPLQGGGIRKLGRVKPWAPPRSYGLVALLDEDGEARGSLHSRADGRNHGVTSVRPLGDGSLLVVSKGGDRVLRIDESSTWRPFVKHVNRSS